MLEIILKNQKLIMIQFLVFAVLFGSVIITAAVVYSKTNMYDLEKQKDKKDLAKSLEKSFSFGQTKGE
ncbi:MAG: hypothetical protein QG567_1999 [Campylobacterota bacterium]|nr:hypothetical protein [Campylobacterota bacterium]